jgi:hypothetical protein
VITKYWAQPEKRHCCRIMHASKWSKIMQTVIWPTKSNPGFAYWPVSTFQGSCRTATAMAAPKRPWHALNKNLKCSGLAWCKVAKKAATQRENH